jgi:flagellar hook-associated protein 1 FlgK
MFEGGGVVPSDAVGLRDRRGVALSKLASLIDIQVEEQPSGGVAVFVGGDFLVLEGQRREVRAAPDSSGDPSKSQIRIVQTDSPLAVDGGELEGLMIARDTILGGFLSDLDQFAATLAFEFNKIFSSGQGLRGFDQVTGTFAVDDTAAPLDAAGLPFTPTSGTFDVLVRNKRTGLTQTTSIRVQLDGLDGDTTLTQLVSSLDAIDGIAAAVTPTRELSISRDSSDIEFSFADDTSGTLAALGINTFFSGHRAQDLGVNQVLRDDPSKFAASAGGIGEDTQVAVRLAAFLDQPLDSAGGTPLATLYDRLISKTTQGATVVKAVAEGFRTFETALSSQQMATSGVSLDEEAVRMITFQRSFQASARYINTISELLDVLVNL